MTKPNKKSRSKSDKSHKGKVRPLLPKTPGTTAECPINLTGQESPAVSLAAQAPTLQPSHSGDHHQNQRHTTAFFSYMENPHGPGHQQAPVPTSFTTQYEYPPPLAGMLAGGYRSDSHFFDPPSAGAPSTMRTRVPPQGFVAGVEDVGLYSASPRPTATVGTNQPDTAVQMLSGGYSVNGVMYSGIPQGSTSRGYFGFPDPGAALSALAGQSVRRTQLGFSVHQPFSAQTTQTPTKDKGKGKEITQSNSAFEVFQGLRNGFQASDGSDWSKLEADWLKSFNERRSQRWQQDIRLLHLSTTAGSFEQMYNLEREDRYHAEVDPPQEYSHAWHRLRVYQAVQDLQFPGHRATNRDRHEFWSQVSPSMEGYGSGFDVNAMYTRINNKAYLIDHNGELVRLDVAWNTRMYENGHASRGPHERYVRSVEDGLRARLTTSGQDIFEPHLFGRRAETAAEIEAAKQLAEIAAKDSRCVAQLRSPA